MTRTIICILAILGALTASAQARQSAATKADAVKVVKIISADKTKIGTYCKLSDLNDEIAKTDDADKLEQLGKQADELEKTLGTEFTLLEAALDQVNFETEEGQAISVELDKLDALCPSKL